jgi:hypothetical protein
METSQEDALQALLTFRTQMLEQLGNEYISGMNQAFDIAISGLEKSVAHSAVNASTLGPGLTVAIDILKDLKVEAVKTFSDINDNAVNNSTQTETNGETSNG